MNIQKKKRFFKLNFINMIFLILYSCNLNTTYKNRNSDKEDAEIITDKLYSLLDKDSLFQAEKLFSYKFLKNTPKDSLYNMFNQIKKLGKLENKELLNWETLVIKGGNSKSNYMLNYKVNYKNYPANETIYLEKEGDSIMIVAYRVFSDGFN